MIKNYDQEIEKQYHPENFENSDEEEDLYETCPSCKAEDYRKVVIGNKNDGYDWFGEMECDTCGYQDMEVGYEEGESNV